MANENPKLTITLTGRPPVRITKTDWPIIAEATDDQYSGEIKSQADRTTDYSLRVRQHTDGRTIVYGIYSYDTRWQGERGREVRRGALYSPGMDVVQAIKDMGREMSEATGEEEFARLAHECIADLPAVEVL